LRPPPKGSDAGPLGDADDADSGAGSDTAGAAARAVVVARGTVGVGVERRDGRDPAVLGSSDGRGAAVMGALASGSTGPEDVGVRVVRGAASAAAACASSDAPSARAGSEPDVVRSCGSTSRASDTAPRVRTA